MGESQNVYIRAQERNSKIIASQKKKKDAAAKRSGNAAQQGERDAKKAAAAKRRGARAAGGIGGNSRTSLKRAARRAGRGISIQSRKNSKSFAGRIQYVSDKNKNAEFIATNCGSAERVLQVMELAARLRPDIKQPCGHIIASLPPRFGNGEKRWSEIATELRSQIGLDDSFPYLVERHHDQDHDHVHLIFCRISVDGRVHDQRNIGLRCAAIEPVIERKFNLQIVPRSEFKTHGHMSKDELEMGLRIGELPPRLQIAAALTAAVQGNPTTAQFVERLQAAGVGVLANVSPTTGKMSGFSFTYAGIHFSGSKIGREYGWKQLSEVIKYEQSRDTEFLKALNGSTGTASRDLAAATACINALDRAVAEVNPTTPDSTANRRNYTAAAHRAVSSTRASAPTAPAHPVNRTSTTPAGFSRTQVLDDGMRSWANTLHNRIVLGRIQDQRLSALLDARERVAAVSINNDWAIPNHKTISEEQLLSLLLHVESSPIHLKGDPDFCERIERLAKLHGLAIQHAHQVDEAEKKEFEKRYEAARIAEQINQSEQFNHQPR